MLFRFSNIRVNVKMFIRLHLLLGKLYFQENVYIKLAIIRLNENMFTHIFRTYFYWKYLFSNTPILPSQKK